MVREYMALSAHTFRAKHLGQCWLDLIRDNDGDSLAALIDCGHFPVDQPIKLDGKLAEWPLAWIAITHRPACAVAEVLLEKGASALTIVDDSGSTPLSIAASKGAQALSKLMLRFHAVDHPAVLSAFKEVINREQPTEMADFLDAGIDVFGKDLKGHSPLHWTRVWNQDRVTLSLLERVDYRIPPGFHEMDSLARFVAREFNFRLAEAIDAAGGAEALKNAALGDADARGLRAYLRSRAARQAAEGSLQTVASCRDLP
jgi:hypothetical protein